MITGWKMPHIKGKAKPNRGHVIIENAKVRDFIISSKRWNTSSLANISLNDILNKIKSHSYRIITLDDRVGMKFTSNDEFLVKIEKWANNDKTPQHLKAKLLNSLWKFNLIPRIKFFS